MSSASDLTTVQYIFKKMYADSIGDEQKREHPLYANISKVARFYGEEFRYSVKYGGAQGVSGTFADAQTGAASSKGLQFAALRFTKYGVITLKAEAIAASQGNEGALIELVTEETDSIIEELVDSDAFDLYRDKSGNRGQRASISTNTVTMVVADDARNFKVGMTVIASANADGSSPRTGSTTVASVDEDAGTVTLTSAAAITSFADNDYLFRKGDPATCMEGLAVCTPLTAPTSGDSFRGKDRSVDVARLAGSRINDTSVNIEENGGLVAVKIGQRGGRARQLYLNPISFWQVSRRLGAKVEYVSGQDATYAFESFMVATPAGTLQAISDADCPTNRGYVCNPDAHYLRHLYGLPHIVDDDGNMNLRQTSDDGIEARARSWKNYIQKKPRDFGVFAI